MEALYVVTEHQLGRRSSPFSQRASSQALGVNASFLIHLDA